MLNLKSQLFNFLKNIISRISITRRQYYWITVVACFFIAAIIVTGASVRVTGSGLGCTTWPKCTAESFAPTKEQSGHSTIEWANRLFTGAVSLSVMVAVLGSLMLKHR